MFCDYGDVCASACALKITVTAFVLISLAISLMTKAMFVCLFVFLSCTQRLVNVVRSS